ncbi:hypothetical protein C8R32_10985 [Nitrosospira sp. Nsp5]|nr:hypothetical protein C8R32_10985 [Nitrosospira sp. Nsp5]
MTRIDVARCYLEPTDLSYKEIAQRCGLEIKGAKRWVMDQSLLKTW